MKLPLFIAHGEGVITLVFLGFPAALIGIVCLIVSAVLAAKKKEEDRKTVRVLAACGGGALLVTLFSPFIGRLIGL